MRDGTLKYILIKENINIFIQILVICMFIIFNLFDSYIHIEYMTNHFETVSMKTIATIMYQSTG